MIFGLHRKLIIDQNTKIKYRTFLRVAMISGFAVYHQLGNFAHLKNADGVLTDMRSMVLWDIRFPRIG